MIFTELRTLPCRLFRLTSYSDTPDPYMARVLAVSVLMPFVLCLGSALGLTILSVFFGNLNIARSSAGDLWRMANPLEHWVVLIPVAYHCPATVRLVLRVGGVNLKGDN